MRKVLRQRVDLHQMAADALTAVAPPALHRDCNARPLRQRRAKFTNDAATQRRNRALLLGETLSPRASEPLAQCGRALLLLCETRGRMDQPS